jgi:8-amino-7-oxononanoate synthase
MAALDFLEGELRALEVAGLDRSLRQLGTIQGPEVNLDGRRVINFASNDYLGLASEQLLVQAAHAALVRWGTGTGASRLIAGNLGEHEDLEREVAAFHGAPAALLFSTGYHANVGVIAALAGPDDLIVSDTLNHASLIDGCRLSRARIAVYRHGDAAHAGELLAARARRRFLVSESVFSMEGDRAPVVELAEVAARARAVFVLDEAHAVGWAGPAGRGLASAHDVHPDVLIGTFGKAFGSFGGYVVGSVGLRRWLINRARTFVFTTGLPGSVVAASRAALAFVAGPEGEARRATLAMAVEELSARLTGMGLTTSRATTPITPLRVGVDSAAMAATSALLDLGLYVQGIRPPTVPRGTARLRICLSAMHSSDQIARLAAALAEALPP